MKVNIVIGDKVIDITSKPKTYKAMRFIGKNHKEIFKFCKKWHGCSLDYDYVGRQIRITSSGDYHTSFSYLNYGDWVAKYPGENSFFLIKAKRFKEDYES